jgi:methionyl aminopeptidase
MRASPDVTNRRDRTRVDRGYASGVSIETEEELNALRAAGKVVAEALRAMRRAVRPGISTLELDQIGGRVFRDAGARSGPQLTYGFPGVNCISVNDEAVHGVPSRRRLRDGDLVKLDVTAELDGYYADACVTVIAGRPRGHGAALIATARRALEEALKVARAGTPLNAVGATVERTVTERGHSVCAELMGHGIGRSLHEDPNVPNVYVPDLKEPLTEGLVMTIEPIIAAGGGAVREAEDGWTFKTADGSLAAHFEHTLVITADRPVLLTA